MLDRDIALLDMIANPVVSAMYVLHGGLMLRVFRHLDSRCVIDHDRGGTRHIVSEFAQQISHPYHLTPHLRDRRIFRFGA